jgi:hypothetical protein
VVALEQVTGSQNRLPRKLYETLSHTVRITRTLMVMTKTYSYLRVVHNVILREARAA